MATKAEQFKSEQQRSKPPTPKKVVKESRSARTAEKKAAQKDLPPTKSAKGSEHAQQMKAATASARHGRRAG